MAPFTHGSKRAAGLDCSEESVDETELTLDDQGHDVVREVSRVRPQMRTDDARLAFPRDPRREVPPMRGLLKRYLHDADGTPVTSRAPPVSVAPAPTPVGHPPKTLEPAHNDARGGAGRASPNAGGESPCSQRFHWGRSPSANDRSPEVTSLLLEPVTVVRCIYGVSSVLGNDGDLPDDVVVEVVELLGGHPQLDQVVAAG